MNKEKRIPYILVLGANGMVGRVVFTYLFRVFPNTTWGTIREKKQGFFALSVKSLQKDLKKIIKEIGHVDYVINCIGILRNSKNLGDLITVNENFPKKLVKLGRKYRFAIIHISTDAVFSALSGKVNEKNTPKPDDAYGMSKLLGEIRAKNFLSIRTSFTNFVWVLKEKSREIEGFDNQLWSGCTTLQFAFFCEDIIVNNRFEMLRKKSPFFHFTPITPISNYALVKEFCVIKKINKKVKKSTGEKISRILTTKYEKLLHLDDFKRTPKNALRQLIEFEKMMIV